MHIIFIMYEKIEHHYNERIQKTEISLKETRRKLYTTGTLRLIVFLATILLAFFLWNSGTIIVSLIIITGLVLFLMLLLAFNKLQKQKNYLSTSLGCDKNELKALNYDFSPFDGATENIDSSHSFGLDLDIFGKDSVFQSINRTCTTYGKRILIDWFEKPLTQASLIQERQKVIRELSQKNSFFHHFRITGLINEGGKNDFEEIKEFAESEEIIPHKKLWKTLGIIFPCIWIIVIVLTVLYDLPFGIAVTTFIITWLISESQAKKVNILQEYVGKKVDILNSYSDLIRITENETFKSEELNKLQKHFSNREKHASSLIRKLATTANELEQRANLLVHLILNPFMLWDINKSIDLENWKLKYGEDLINWIRYIGEVDAYISLGIFSFNHPDYTFPAFTDRYFEMQGKSLGHPLMNRETCVRNDIDILKHPYFLIITGANMAGKSTYLRTVGVNFVLACIGSPVCAENLTVYPATLVTSLRTSDSLNDNESYFFAELKRLKMIIDKLENGEKLFIILDEILKGTNSVDKQKGSLALIQQFIRLQSCGIIATHDLLLGSLEKEFPDSIKNYRFEADIKNNELTFSYLLREGIAQNMNASFLMKKMGITV